VECRSGLVELIAEVIGLVDVRLARPCRPVHILGSEYVVDRYVGAKAV